VHLPTLAECCSLLARRPGELVPSSLFANIKRVRSSLLQSPAGAYRRSQRVVLCSRGAP
jgi:hypothetical protein